MTVQFGTDPTLCPNKHRYRVKTIETFIHPLVDGLLSAIPESERRKNIDSFLRNADLYIKKAMIQEGRGGPPLHSQLLEHVIPQYKASYIITQEEREGAN